MDASATLTCPDCQAPVPQGRLSCPACGSLLAAVTGGRAARVPAVATAASAGAEEARGETGPASEASADEPPSREQPTLADEREPRDGLWTTEDLSPADASFAAEEATAPASEPAWPPVLHPAADVADLPPALAAQPGSAVTPPAEPPAAPVETRARVRPLAPPLPPITATAEVEPPLGPGQWYSQRYGTLPTNAATPEAGSAGVFSDLPFRWPPGLGGRIAAGGAWLAALAFLLPWAQGLGYLDAWGVASGARALVFLATVVVGLVMVVPSRLPAFFCWGYLPFGWGAFLLGLWWSRADHLAAEAIGSWLLLVAALAALTGGVLALRELDRAAPGGSAPASSGGPDRA